MSDIDERLVKLAAGIKAKNANAEAAKVKARDDIARAATLPELKAALLRWLA